MIHWAIEPRNIQGKRVFALAVCNGSGLLSGCTDAGYYETVEEARAMYEHLQKPHIELPPTGTE